MSQIKSADKTLNIGAIGLEFERLVGLLHRFLALVQHVQTERLAEQERRAPRGRLVDNDEIVERQVVLLERVGELESHKVLVAVHCQLVGDVALLPPLVVVFVVAEARHVHTSGQRFVGYVQNGLILDR